MRFIAILCLIVAAYLSVEALKEQQLQQIHAGYCPMHMVICAIYCPPDSINLLFPRQINGCRRDTDCASDEKCCRPACGCTNRCTKALEKPGLNNFP